MQYGQGVHRDPLLQNGETHFGSLPKHFSAKLRVVDVYAMLADGRLIALKAQTIGNVFKSLGESFFLQIDMIEEPFGGARLSFGGSADR